MKNNFSSTEEKKMLYFDLHAHPSLKGSLTRDPIENNAWNEVTLRKIFLGRLTRLKQIFNSQASLTQLSKPPVLSVVSFVAIEKAFAESFVINTILASRIFSPLNRQLLIDVIRGTKTYFDMFENDFHHLLRAKEIIEFNIVSHIDQLDPARLNVILSVEGAHSFQDKSASSILENLKKYKEIVRFHHLTLTHLTRQPACVHCFGVRVKVIGDLMSNVNFRPDPRAIGISNLGFAIISIAYDTNPKRILIDIKHMSYVSRKQFYQWRRGTGNAEIPLIASHIGVTGCSFENARIHDIVWGENDHECDEIFWCKQKSKSKTYFNPWTINLYDEDIVEILNSKGLIGISLDERILGYGDIYGEYMSQKEVDELKLKDKISPCADDLKSRFIMEAEKRDFGFLQDPGVKTILNYEHSQEQVTKALDNSELTGDLLFYTDDEIDEETRRFGDSGKSHCDYLACNIIHILKVGLKNGFDGTSGKEHVSKCICIGSDLDGIIDPMNFTKASNNDSLDQKNWVTVDEYAQLKEQLKISMIECLKNDDDINGMIDDIDELLQMTFCTNGLEFLKRNFN